jgi:hypothetical protein
MKAAVAGIFVFRTAPVAHEKVFHGRPHTIVGESFEDAVSGAAVRAVREWVKVSAIVSVEDLAQTIRTRRNIRQNNRRFWAGQAAVAHFKRTVAGRLQIRRLHITNIRVLRCVRPQAEKKLLQHFLAAFHFDRSALRRIANPSRYADFAGNPENERPEAYALHGS